MCFLLIDNTFIAITYNQGGLSKKEIQRNLCNIFSIFIFKELFIHLVSLNRVRADTFIKYLARVASLIFLVLTLI